MIIIKPATVQTNEACILVENGANIVTEPCSLMPPMCSLVKFCTKY